MHDADIPRQNRPFQTLSSVTLAVVVAWTAPSHAQTHGWLWSAQSPPRPATLAGVGTDPAASFRLELTDPLATDERPRPFSPEPAEFRGWYRPLVSPAAPSVWLADGSCLAGQLQEIDSQSVTLQTELLGRVTLPRSELHALELQSPLGSQADRAARRTDLAQSPAGPAPAMLWLANGDQLPAELLRLTADHVECARGGETFQLERTAVAGWRRASPPNRPADLDAAWVRVTLVDGSQLVLRQITAQDDYRWTLQRPDGSEWIAASLDDRRWEDAIAGIEPVSGSRRLSELDELNYRQASLWGPSIPLRRKLSAAGTPLVVGGAHFADGLGARSLSRLTLAVAPDWQAFQALAGIDDAGGDLGSVVFRVLTYSDREGWRELASTGLVRRGDAPRPIHVSLRGAQRLALVVDPADDGDAGDLADWLMARIVTAN